jgi:ABC-type thiamin/hydroxymethylpyrimidine transport system permease subunit
MLLLSVVVIIGNVYFLEWQTYVLRIDLILHSLSLGVVAMEFILGIFCVISFASSNS